MIVDNLTLEKCLGKGSFGEVYLTTKKGSNEKFATKKLEREQIEKSEAMKYLKNEIIILQNLKHPNIVRFEDVKKTKKHFYIVMEYCNGGELSKALEKYQEKYRRPFSEEIVQHLMRQIIGAFKYIHGLKIIHRDIKLDNILLNFESEEDKANLNMMKANCKIIDFGFACRISKSGLQYSTLGSPINMDPIILKKLNSTGRKARQLGYDQKADIWSLGAICYEMLTGENLFKANDLPELQEQAEKGDYFLPLNYGLSNEIISFLNLMLQYDPNERASTQELLEHDFLTKNVNDFQPANVSQIGYKIHNGVLTINFIDNDTIKKIFNPSFAKKNDNKFNLANQGNIICIHFDELPRTTELNENIKQYMHELLDDYQKAEKYFRNNKLISQEEDAKNKMILINTKYNQIKLGQKIDIKDLPKAITPEYIYGCSTEERNAIYEKAINQYKEKRTKCIKSNGDKEKIKKYDYCIINIEKHYNDKWAPPPKLIERSVASATNLNGKKYQIKFMINKEDNSNEYTNFVISLKVNDLKMLKECVQLNQQNNFTKEWIWDIDENDWLIIDNNNENFILYIDYIFNNSKPVKIEYDIENIKLGKPLEFNITSPLSHSAFNLILTPVISNSSSGKKDIIVETLYPAFKGQSFVSKSSII